MDRELGFLGWSQAELARRLGVKPATVTSWRRRGVPRTVQAYLEAMMRLKETGDALTDYAARTKRKARRTSERIEFPTDGTARLVPEADYRKRLERSEDADMDQDSDEWERN